MPRSFFPELEPLTPGGRQASTLWLDAWRRSRRAADVVLAGDEVVTTTTGASFDIDLTGGDALLCNNASLLTLQGLAVGQESAHQVPILAIGAGTVEIVHESVAAPEARRFHTGSGVTLRLVGGRGSAIAEYDNTSQRYRILAHQQGAAIAQVYAAGDFTASAGSWTVASGDVVRNHYTLVGRRLTVEILLQTTSVSATPASLAMAIPGGYTAGAAVRIPVELSDNGTPAMGIASVSAGGTTITFTRLDAAAFATSVDLTRVAGVLSFEVQG